MEFLNLPKDWENMVQVRDFIRPVNSISNVGLLIFMIRNDKDQYYTYSQSMEVPHKLFDDSGKSFKDIVRESYQEFLYKMPAIAVNQSVVLSTKDLMHNIYEPIKSQNWSMIRDVTLKTYEEYIK